MAGMHNPFSAIPFTATKDAGGGAGMPPQTPQTAAPAAATPPSPPAQQFTASDIAAKLRQQYPTSSAGKSDQQLVTEFTARYPQWKTRIKPGGTGQVLGMETPAQRAAMPQISAPERRTLGSSLEQGAKGLIEGTPQEPHPMLAAAGAALSQISMTDLVKMGWNVMTHPIDSTASLLKTDLGLQMLGMEAIADPKAAVAKLKNAADNASQDMMTSFAEKPGATVGSLAGAAVSMLVVPNAIAKLPEVARANAVERAAVQHFGASGAELAASMTSAEKAKPGLFTSIGKFSQSMPAAAGIKNAMVVRRSEAIAKIGDAMTAVADSPRMATGEVAEKVSKAADASWKMANTIEGERYQTLSEAITGESKSREAIGVGERTAIDLTTSKDEVRTARNALYDVVKAQLGDRDIDVESGPLMHTAMDWLRESSSSFGSQIPPEVKNFLGRLMPMRQLDQEAGAWQTEENIKRADVMRGQPLDAAGRAELGRLLTPVTEADFLSLPRAAQDEIMAKVTPRPMSLTDAIVTKRYLNQSLRAMNEKAGAKLAVDTSIRNELNRMIEAAMPADVAPAWRIAETVSYNEAQRLNNILLHKIFFSKQPMARELITAKAMESPSNARTLVANLGRRWSPGLNRLVKSTDTHALQELQRYALDDLARIGADNPKAALDALTSDKKGYGYVLRRGTQDKQAYEKAVAYWTNRVERMGNTPEGRLYRGLQSLAGEKDPTTVIRRLLNPDENALTNHVLTAINHDPEMVAQVGSQMLERVLSDATDVGDFRAQGAFIDPIALSKKLGDAMPQLRKFMPEKAEALESLRSILAKATMRPGESMIGAYRSSEYLWGASMGMGVLFGSSTGMMMAGGLTAGPYVTMKLMTNPTTSRLLLEGIAASRDAKQWAAWTFRAGQFVNLIRAQAEREQQLKQQ